MIIGSRCYSKECTQKPKYYCCNPQLPACIDCSSQPCLHCTKRRNKPLKTLSTHSTVTSHLTTCHKCEKTASHIAVSFPCSHTLCRMCVCESVCELIRSEKWLKGRLSLQCACPVNCSTGIQAILQKYCFCCGQGFEGGKSLTLSMGLQLRSNCRNRVKYGEGSISSTQRYFMTKHELHLLIREEKQLPKEYPSAAQCIAKATVSESEPSRNIQQPANSKQTQQQQAEKAKKAEKVEKAEEVGKKCLNCQKQFIPKESSEIMEALLCQACISKNKQFLQKSNRQHNQSSPAASGRTLQERTEGAFSKKQKGASSNEAPQDETYECLSCGKVEPNSVTKTISAELGSHLCSTCLHSQSKLVQLSQNRQQKETNPFSEHVRKQRQYEMFGQNIPLKQPGFEPTSRQGGVRMVEASLIQQHPDSVQVELFITDEGEESCFQCGFFVASASLVPHAIGKFCLSCMTSLAALKQGPS